MRNSKSNHNLLRLSFVAMIFTVLFSCKKDTRELQETQNEVASGQVSTANSLKGLSTFLKIPEVDKRLKAGIDTNDYRYFAQTENNQLWIIGLKPGTLGFAKAKVSANLKDGKLSLIVVAYNFNTALYKKGDFSTYTGTTSVYNQKLEKLHDLVYEKGKLQKIIKADCPTCIVFVTEFNYTCSSYPPLCDFYGGETGGSGDDLDNFMKNPDSGGGSGEEVDYTAMTYQLNAILKPGDSYTFDNTLDPSQSWEFSSVSQFEEFLATNSANATVDLSVPATVIDPNNKIEHAFGLENGKWN